ncbi:MAG: iron ABC transporter substrate-binding protein, partial [Burkholderia gladioli]
MPTPRFVHAARAYLKLAEPARRAANLAAAAIVLGGAAVCASPAMAQAPAPAAATTVTDLAGRTIRI